MVSPRFCFQFNFLLVISLFLAPSQISIDSIFKVNTVDVNVILTLTTKLLDVSDNARWTQIEKTWENKFRSIP